MRLWLIALFGLILAGTVHAQAVAPDDPFIWLEDAEAPAALDWARAENAQSLGVLEADRRFPTFRAEALKIAEAKDRIPAITLAPGDRVRNFWQDADHVHGVWRDASLAGYRTGKPDWATLIDVDALAKAEGRNWVWRGATCLPPQERLCLVALSNGGKDAVEVREFDVAARRFVEGGFHLPEGRHRYEWKDADTLLVVTAWTPSEVTAAGYPYVMKALSRGEPLSAAREVFRGDAADGGYGVSPLVLRDARGRVVEIVAHRPLDTFRSAYARLTPQGPQAMALPGKASVEGVIDGRIIVTVDEAWAGLEAGDLVSVDPARPSTAPRLMLRPGASEMIHRVRIADGRAVVALYENVKGSLVTLTPGANGAWRRASTPLPAGGSVAIDWSSPQDSRVVVTTAGFLDPDTQWLADLDGGPPARLAALPPRFDASPYVVEQQWAVSKDGTRVPYFMIRAKALAFDGTAPTVVRAYGGFQSSMTPSYLGAVGKLWLDQGGVYVIANIRGGGEFGPRWHEAGLKAHRQRVFDDLYAVSEDLVRRKVTSPRRLGAVGGSNGGLLMGVALTQRPDLYRGIVIAVPLLDMIRYTKIAAGPSWTGEYGDPADPAERKVIEAYSPYQNLKPGQAYPQPFLVTSTKDDRVGPAHARKMAARMKAMGYDYLYYENIDGGHSAAANLNEAARRQALEFVYFARRLID